MPDIPTFDPSQPFTVADEPKFDPSQPFTLQDQQPAAAPPQTSLAEMARMFAPQPPAARSGPISTNSGGTPQKIAPDTALGEDFGADLWRDLNRPAVSIPKMNVNPDDHPAVAVGKEVVNLAAGIPEFFESPLGAATAGAGSVGGAVARAVSGGFAAQMLHSLGQQAVQTYGDWKQMTPAQKAVAVTDMAGTGVFAAITGAHAAGIDLKPASKPEPATPPETFSEFGGEKLDVQPADAEATAAPKLTNPEGTTLPESPDTLVAQMKWLKDGKRAAVLFTHPDQAIPEFFSSEDEGKFAVKETPAGRFLYDASQLTGDQIDAAVALNQVGKLLGYGIDDKPAPGTEVGAVVIRDQAGREKQAVTTDAANLPSVFAAAQKLVGAGDTVRLETPEQVLSWRQQANAPKATATTERARMVQENTEALKGLSGAKLNEAAPAAPVTPTETLPATPLVKVDVTPAEYSAARAGLKVGTSREIALRLADEAKRAEVFGQVSNTERPGETEPMPVHQLFVGDTFQLAGQPMRVTEAVTDAETGQPAGYQVDGAYGPQYLPGDAVVHVDAGSVKAEWEQKLDSLKLDTNGQLHAFGLLPEAWNTLVETVKLAVKGGLAVKEAIDQGLAKLRAAGAVPKEFDEAGARQHLTTTLAATGQPGRQRVATVQASPVVSPEVKALVQGDATYEVRRFAQIQAEAASILQARGLDGAIELFKQNAPDMPADTRTALGAAIQEQLRTAEQSARTAGDTATAAALAAKQVAVWRADAYGTEMAQGLNARKLYDRMSPTAMLAAARQVIGEAGEKAWQRVKPAMDTAKNILQQANREALGDLRVDKATNDAARGAVNEAVKGSDTTHKAVIAELSQEWAQADPTGTILKQAQEQLAAHAQNVWGKQNKMLPTAPQARIDLRNMLGDMAKRAAGIFGAHMQGADPGVPIVDKFIQRLGLSRANAVKLATTLSKEWDAQLKLAKEKLDKRIINQRAKQLQGLAPDANDAAVDRAIRAQLKTLNLKLGDVLQRAPAEAAATGKSIGQHVLDASGLTGEAATQMRATLDRRWEALATAKKQSLLATLQKQQLKPGEKRPAKDAVQKLIKWSNLGAFSDSQFYDAAKQALKLPVLTDELAAEIVRRANDLQAIPEGVLRDRKATELMNLAAAKGAVKWTDVPLGIFYANILSGFTTPAKIVLENSNLLLGNTLSAMAARPGQVMRNPVDFVRGLADAYGRGLVKGGLQAESTLRTGIVTGIYKDIHPSSVLELKPFGEKMDVLNFWKWFGRVISTGHETTFKPAWEMKSQLIAQDVARKEGLTGDKLQQRVADLLANTAEHVDAAKVQATAELGDAGNKLDYQRRVREILEQRREQNMPGITEQSRDFALRTAYLNKPYGFMGLIANTMRYGLNEGRKEFPIAGSLAKTQIPFTTIVANILNEKLNWTPFGTYRAMTSYGWMPRILGGREGELYGREMMDTNERSELYAKSIIGTIALGTLATMFGQHIHGNGPVNSSQRKELMATGWIPHSYEYNGKFYSYMNTPLALGLAVIGNNMDWNRYGHGTEADGSMRAAFVLKSTINAIVSQGMLDSVKRVFDAIGDENTVQGANKWAKMAARTASSFVVPNLLQQIDRVFDPKQYEQDGIAALLTSQLPFVRRDNRPVLNVLGEPVQSGPFHYWANSVTDDPVWKILASKQAWVPEPGKNQIIGDKSKGEGYYRAMTSDEYYNWIRDTGPQIREELANNLDKIALADPMEAKKIVKEIASKIRRPALQEYQP